MNLEHVHRPFPLDRKSEVVMPLKLRNEDVPERGRVLLDCTTGKSTGFTPFRMRPAWTPT